MREPHVDADKICKHIKYTKHWLDKANEDFQEQRFGNGGVILNLARAELTAAWEEVLQLKTQVTKTIPGQARTHWKPLSSVGLLAAGFFIAMFITRMTNAPLPTAREATDGPAPASVQEFIPVIPTESGSYNIGAVREIDPADAAALSETSAVESSTIEESAALAETHAAEETPAPMNTKTAKTTAPAPMKRIQRKPAPKTLPAPARESVPADEPATVIASVQEPAPEPVMEEPAPRTAAPTPEKQRLDNTDIIELFNTASKTLNK